MREILFRGKTEKAEWVEGGLLYDEEQNEAYIAEHFEDKSAYLRPIIPETVGQYTGMTDKNGEKIFEGDVLSHFINYQGRRIKGVVAYDITLAAYMWEPKGLSSLFLTDVLSGNGAEIIGNIHDNPELLEGGE